VGIAANGSFAAQKNRGARNWQKKTFAIELFPDFDALTYWAGSCCESNEQNGQT
jgi:hypothetical protein